TLTQRDSLEVILGRCTSAMVEYLRAALARIWIFDPEEKVLKMRATTGLGSEAINKKMPPIAAELSCGPPTVVNQIAVSGSTDEEWLQKDRIVAYAGYPLTLEDQTVGLMSIFSRTP